MKKINIEITKAQILSFSVILNEKEPIVSATIGLLTDGGKKISDYTVSTQSWNDENKFELPVEIIQPILSIMQTLEGVVIKHCKDNQLRLSSGE